MDFLNKKPGQSSIKPNRTDCQFWRLLLSFTSSMRGQAVVEFTLIFVLLLVIAWIPADFGLAFFSSQLAANASREGARIGAADPSYSTQVGNCTLPACFSLADGTILKETANRLSSALLTRGDHYCGSSFRT